MTPEGQLLAKTVKFAQSKGASTVRLSFARGVARGWPDLLILLPGGQSMFMELKRPGAVPTPLQLHRLESLRELGFKAIWTDNAHAARGAILEALGAAAVHGTGGAASDGQSLRRSTTPSGRP